MTLAIGRRGDLWGDRTAVFDQTTGEAVSYADLAARSEAAASRLATLGIGLGDLLAVVSRTRVELLALLFAARRLGAVFAPIPHRFTPSMAADSLRQLDPGLVIYESAQRDLVRSVPFHDRLSFAAFEHVEATAVEEGSVRTPAVNQTGNDRTTPQWFLPTDSGRTVIVSERQVEWNAITAATAWGLGRADDVLLLDTLDEVHGLLGIALPVLSVGGSLSIQRAFDATDALALVADGSVTALFGSQVTLREVSEESRFEAVDWTAVEWAVSHDRIDTDLADAFRVNGVVVVRQFGQIECGPNALFVPPERSDGTESPATIGLPFPHVEVRITDVDEQPVTPGEVGTLQIGGPVVASGYREAERVVSDETFRNGWVMTGEFARRNPDNGFVVLESNGRR